MSEVSRNQPIESLTHHFTGRFIGHNNLVGESMYLTVWVLHRPILVPGHGRVLQGIFLRLIKDSVAQFLHHFWQLLCHGDKMKRIRRLTACSCVPQSHQVGHISVGHPLFSVAIQSVENDTAKWYRTRASWLDDQRAIRRLQHHLI